MGSNQQSTNEQIQEADIEVRSSTPNRRDGFTRANGVARLNTFSDAIVSYTLELFSTLSSETALMTRNHRAVFC